MKVIETDLLGPKERRDAVNEVQVLSSLKHPYIISYKESFVEDGRLCIIMDYADGGDLYRTISMQKKRGGKGFPYVKPFEIAVTEATRNEQTYIYFALNVYM